MSKTQILLINLGTPHSATYLSIYQYLVEFLLDPCVIDLPRIRRELLVRGFIIPSRLKKVTESYRSIWTPEGSPLLVHSISIRDALQKRLGEGYNVELAMRYGKPSIADTLKKILSQNAISHLVILPLFPQYAAATSGSILQKVFQTLSEQAVIPKVTCIDQFHCHPKWIQACAEVALQPQNYDHVLFSFHGLPQRHIHKANPHCLQKSCCEKPQNVTCYKFQCHKTAEAIAQLLHLQSECFTVCFQSRLGKEPWITPYTSDTLIQLAKKGCQKVLIFCPSFVSDCLETLYEIGVEYRHLFIKHGGQRLDLVPGVNAHPTFIEALAEVIDGK